MTDTKCADTVSATQVSGRPSVEYQMSGRWRPPITEERGRVASSKFPVASKPVKLLQLEVIRSYAQDASPALLARLQQILRYVEEDMYNEVANSDSQWISNVDYADLEVLLRHNIIEATDKAGAKHIGHLFFVEEPHKARRRPIFWPKSINAAIDPPTPALPDIVESALDLEKGGWAACFDLSASFFQVPNGANAKHFAFKTAKGQYYRFLRMVMGVRYAPECMQVICEILGEEARSRVGLMGSVRQTVHIDNIRFWSLSQKHIAAVARSFQEVCVGAGVTLNQEEENAPHQVGVFIGMKFQYDIGTVSLSDKTRSKLVAAETTLQNKEATWADILGVFGICVFASRVTRFALATMWRIFKYVRRRAHAFSVGQIDIDSPAQVWPHTIPVWSDWIARLLAAPPARHGATALDLQADFNMLVTDASLDGYGAILMTASGRLHFLQGRWSQHTAGKNPSLLRPDDINMLEMRAVGLAARKFTAQLRTLPLLVLVDNTSTMYVLRRGQAAELDFNDATRITLEHLRVLGVDTFVAWVDTRSNPSDALSRGLLPASEADLARMNAGMSAARLALMGRRDTPLRVFVPNCG